MKAAILVEQNAPLVVADIDLPKLEVGQVLVQVHCSGICGSQLGEIAGVKGPDKYLPHLLGHEGGGIVLEVGPGVEQVRPGEHVVMHWRKGIGIQSRTPKYWWKKQQVNAGWVTTFNELAIVSENRLTVIPKEIPFSIAALMGCVVPTALGLINNVAKVKIGESVAIFGCGGVGLNVIQGAAMVCADPIIAIDLYDLKLKMAKKFGATHLINPNQTPVDEAIQKIVGPKGVDVAIETTGDCRVIEQAYRLTSPHGRTILVGVPQFNQDITIHTLPLHFGKVLTGCEGGSSEVTTEIPRYLRLYQKGKLRLDDFITHRYPLDEINTAIDKIRSGEVGRVLIQMQ